MKFPPKTTVYKRRRALMTARHQQGVVWRIPRGPHHNRPRGEEGSPRHAVAHRESGKVGLMKQFGVIVEK